MSFPYGCFVMIPLKMRILCGLGFIKINDATMNGLCSICLLFGIFFLLTSFAFASGAELTNLVIKNTQDDLVIDLKINGVITEEMKAAVLNGISVSLTFFILLYEVHDFWFDKKITSITTTHKIQYDALKKEYRITRSWEKTDPLVLKNFEKARQLISEINSLKIIPIAKLKKGKQYQLKAKSELNDKNYLFSSFPWEFETDWYTINFIY